VTQFLYDHPTLIADPRLHTGTITSAAVDRAGSIVVTGSEDKTVRVWSVDNGELLQTIHMPAGPGGIGKVYAVALTGDGDFIAAGGWTAGVEGEETLYVFDRSGKIAKRISGLRDVALKLMFSADGRFLAAALGDLSLRVYDRHNGWAETFCSTEHEDEIYGIAFAEDGRLATTCHDSKIRLYTSDFRLAVPPKTVIVGKWPRQIEFCPIGNLLAVGYADATVVEFFDGDSLESIGTANTQSITISLPQLAWAKDGETLFAGGEGEAIFSWTGSGRGPCHTLPSSKGKLMSLHSLPDGGVLVVTDNPMIKRIGKDGREVWSQGSRGGPRRFWKLAVSHDGTIIDFGLDDNAKAQWRFDVSGPSLIIDPPADGITAPPKQDDRQVEHRRGEFSVDGNVVALDKYEWPRTWAISQDGGRLVFAGKWTLRGRDAKLQPLWRRDGPGSVCSVNIAGNGRLVIVGYDDGTIRWHDMDGGRELLALMLLSDSDKANWVAWTPEGFYAATVGAFGVLRWLINQGSDAMSRTVSVRDVPMLYRPDVLIFMLREGGIGALGIADAYKARKEVQRVTGSAKPPGARLHVLAMGVSEYGVAASNLALKFAAKDAHDLIAAIVDTQDTNGPYRGSGGLYAEIKPRLLLNADASKKRIFAELAAIQRTIAEDDTAIIMFAGHGMTIDGEFYLLPHDVDATELATIKATAIPARGFQKEVERVARHGRVLILLDACQSGAFAFDNLTASNADTLRGIMASGNATVLTSSRGTQTSREDEAWQNGAFTKVLLEALSDPDADSDRNGVISMNELAKYLFKNLPRLTDGAQQLALVSSFEGDLFVTGLRAEQIQPMIVEQRGLAAPLA
jgi:WD40 repeat protein